MMRLKRGTAQFPGDISILTGPYFAFTEGKARSYVTSFGCLEILSSGKPLAFPERARRCSYFCVLHQQIERRLRAAVTAILPDVDTRAVLVRPCPDPKFGDYQCSALISLAKSRRLNPRQLAGDTLAILDVAGWCENVEIAREGYLNFRLKPEALTGVLAAAARGEHLFFQRTLVPRTVVVDFSSPNVAKSMHVGHLRSTGIGDALQRVLRLLGHRVVTDNHIGDWGTQFGMLLIGWKRELDREALEADPINEMDRLYKKVNAECEADPTVREAARAELVRLQSGDAENLAIWHEMKRLSQVQFDELYGRLGVKFDHVLGESFYNPQLQAVVDELQAKGIARESQGAVAVFSDGTLPPKDDPFLVSFKGEWVPDPALIRKSDGGFNYTTTDLATIAYRLKTWSPDEILYVVDDRQAPHFRRLFLTFARWQPEAATRVKLRHVAFGKMLGPDKKPITSRTNKIRIEELLLLNPETFLTESAIEVKIAHLIPQHRHTEVIAWPSLFAEMFPVPSTDEHTSLAKLKRKSDGGTVQQPEGLTEKLAVLLDEAQEIAFSKVAEKNPTLSEAEQRAIARVVGLGAVKYADLLPNRESDYVFSLEKMLELDGNTAPYILYAYTRVRSIFRKAEIADLESPTANLTLSAPEEIALAEHLLNFGLELEAVAEQCKPSFLCSYLYELAGRFSQFFEACPVLKAEGNARATRLALCDLTGRVLKQGLEVLGIETLEQM